MKVLFRLLDQERDNNNVRMLVVDKELPVISDTEILIRVEACKTLDLHHEIIKELFLKSPRPHIPGAVQMSGEVVEVGQEVTSICLGNKVAGMLPITSDWSGAGEFCLLTEFDVVRLPEEVDCVTAASVLMDSLHTYTALQYMSSISGGDVVLVLEAASSKGRLAMQLATIWQAKVIAVVSTLDEKSVLLKLPKPPAQVIVGNTSTLVNQVIEETGGMGVNIVLDNGVRIFPKESLESDIYQQRPTKHDIISMLAVGGHWVTSCPHFQLDPPDSNSLLLRSASLHFLMPHTWMLCPSRHGRLQHILHDFFGKVSRKEVLLELPEISNLSKVLDNAESDLFLPPGTLLEL